MPKISMDGLDGLQASFEQLAQADDETIYTILQAAADVYIPALTERLDQLLHPGHTGQLQKSIQAFRRAGKESGEPYLLIYPEGPRRKDRKTDRTSTRQGKKSKTADNATVGFLLEYGTPRMDALHWMEQTIESKAGEAMAAAQAALDRWITSLGL